MLNYTKSYTHIYKLLIIVYLGLQVAFVTISQDVHGVQNIRGDGTLRRIKVPILMYHYVGILPEDADAIRTNLTIHPDLFREHLAFLAENGFSGISLYEMNLALEYGTPLPEQPVILTFDDGYIDHYTHVYPALQEYGFTATFFVVSEFADNSLPEYLSWTQITEMSAAGMSIEAHTKSHASLSQRGYDFLVYEILGSIESIQHHTRFEPRMLAYPGGRYDESTLAMLETSRILRALTTESGIYHTTDNYLLSSRMRVTNETGTAGLKVLLNYEG